MAAPERKLAAVATKLVTCPALLLLHEPLEHFSCPQDLAAAHHLLKSLTTAARQLHINVIMTQQVMQDADFEVVDHVVMLDQQARPVYAGSPDKVKHPAFHADSSFACIFTDVLPVCHR